MTRDQVHDLMENELRCVQRGNYCDRDCAKCPLVKDDKELIEAYGYVIKELEQEPCEDVVSRQEVLDQTYLWSKDEFLRVTNPFDYLRKRINSLKTVTPQPKIGSWKRISIDKYVQHAMAYYKCSVCDKDIIGTHNYCPSCGAKMDVEEK